MAENLPLALDQSTSQRIHAALEDAVSTCMQRLWSSEEGHLGKIAERWFRHECGLYLHRIAEAELDKAAKLASPEPATEEHEALAEGSGPVAVPNGERDK